MAITNITGPKESFDGFMSVWNAAHLPVLYKITNNLFPTNQVDAVKNIASVINDNGNLRFSIFEVAPTYSKGDYLTVFDSTLDGYNQERVKILNVVEVNPGVEYAYILDQAYLGVASIKVVKYYNNYHYRVKVFTGLAPAHVLAAQKPMQLIAERKVDVFKNEADVFVNTLISGTKSIVFKNFTLENANDFNDINAFNEFYIQVKESYDNAVTNYEVDGDCGGEPKQVEFNSTFNVDMDGWVNIPTPFSGFYWDVNKTSFDTNGNDIQTRILSRDYPFLSGENYFISLDYILQNEPISPNAVIYIQLVDTSGGGTLLTTIYGQNFNSSGSITEFNFVPVQNYDKIRVGIQHQGGIGSNKFSLDNIKLETITDQDCINYYCATNSALKFQNGFGGNMAQYVVNEQYEAKFLTDFNELVYFDGYPFDVSIIIPDKAAYKTVVSTYNKQGVLIATTEYSIPAQDEGLYRLKNFLAAVTDTTDKMEVHIMKGAVKVSETITIKVDHENCKYPFYVTWLNTLGGWNYFLFKGDKSYGLRTENVVVTEQDIYSGWPNEYKNGTTLRDVKQKSADDTLVIRSQAFQEENIKAVMGMAYSVEVYHINGNKMRKLIIPPVSNENLHKDSQGTYTFDTDAFYTDSLAIQSK